MKRLRFAVPILIILVMSLYAWVGVEWIIYDVYVAKLPAGCGLTFYGTETQPVFTITYGCPYKDEVRLWPLPVVSPWFEDWEFEGVKMMAGFRCML